MLPALTLRSEARHRGPRDAHVVTADQEAGSAGKRVLRSLERDPHLNHVSAVVDAGPSPAEATWSSHVCSFKSTTDVSEDGNGEDSQGGYVGIFFLPENLSDRARMFRYNLVHTYTCSSCETSLRGPQV